MTRQRLRGGLLAVAAVMLVGCGGGSSTAPTSSGATVSTSGTTVAPTEPVTTPAPSTTAAPTTAATTTVPAPTTTVARTLVADPTLVEVLPELDGYSYRALAVADLGDAALLIDPPRAREVVGLERYALVEVSRGGQVEARLVLFGFDAAHPDNLELEKSFGWFAGARVGRLTGEAQPGFFAIEAVTEGSGPTASAITWYHAGVGYLAWSGTKYRLVRFVADLTVAQHIQPEFETREQMEGDELPAKFSNLGGDCRWWPIDLAITSESTMLRYGNDWRSGEFPLAEHFGLRDFACGSVTDDTLRLGSMSIVQMQQEFVDHDFAGWFVSAYDADSATGSRWLDGRQIVIYEGGVVRWIQDGFLYQLVGGTAYRGGQERPNFTDDELVAMAEALITANA